jgi:DUF1680 family protein
MRHLTAILLASLGAAQPARAALPVSAVAAPAHAFALGDVVLLDSPFKSAMERNADYLLSIEPDRLLHNTRLYAGLAPKGELYGGWESGGIAGHTLGHYLTAISQQYAATGDARFKRRIDYIISEMAACQQAYGDGYIGALPPTELATLRGFREGKVEVLTPFVFKSGAWVPWYSEHKVLNGLKDAWILGGSDQARAVTLRMADWVDSVTAGLTPAQLQEMLRVEQGGMMDVLVEIYSLTGNPRYLATARRFYHNAVLDPLLEGRDELVGKHANTQIPKVIGAARTYEVTGDPRGRAIAENFWDLVVHHYSYAIGGDSDDEHFYPEDSMSSHLDTNTAETCNTYNMLKLTQHLFCWDPGTDTADFYERALYNHILASQDPRKGMFTYFMSLKPGMFRTYSTPFDTFWCCVGTGMENHTKYGGAIYYHGVDDLYVNLFIPSVLTWGEQGFGLEQDTDYPRGDQTRLTVTRAPANELSLKVRCPGWAAGPVTFDLNGRGLPDAGTPGTYGVIRRVWRAGDVLTVTIPMAVRTEALPGAPTRVAFLYGPVVLAGDLGPPPEGATIPYAQNQYANAGEAATPVPVLVLRDGPAESSVVRSRDGSLTFRTAGMGRPTDVTLLPFWEISFNRYNVYWDIVTENQWRGLGSQEPSGF